MVSKILYTCEFVIGLFRLQTEAMQNNWEQSYLTLFLINNKKKGFDLTENS